MGDENSMAGQTKAHKHSALSSDGGFLETTVTGVTNLSNGSIVYGDASEIVTELTAGSDGDALQISSGVPAWVTGSAGASGWEFVEEFVLGSKQVYFTCTLASIIQLADYNVLFQWWLKNEDISSNMEAKINDKTVYLNGNTATSGWTVSGGVQIPANSWSIGNLIYYGNTIDTNYTMGLIECTHGTTSSGNLAGSPYRASIRNSVATHELEEIKFFPTNGDQYAGNIVRVYRMATS
jgi:hypothetical protein